MKNNTGIDKCREDEFSNISFTYPSKEKVSHSFCDHNFIFLEKVSVAYKDIITTKIKYCYDYVADEYIKIDFNYNLILNGDIDSKAKVQMVKSYKDYVQAIRGFVHFVMNICSFTNVQTIVRPGSNTTMIKTDSIGTTIWVQNIYLNTLMKEIETLLDAYNNGINVVYTEYGPIRWK